MQVPCLLALAVVQGWLVLPLAALMAASIFGQVTVNETMTARYVAPALRVKLYSIRFTIGFLGAAAPRPLVGFLHEATGSLAAPMLVLAGFGAVTFACALVFPNRREELQPELWLAGPAAGRRASAARPAWPAPGRRRPRAASDCVKSVGTFACRPQGCGGSRPGDGRQPWPGRRFPSPTLARSLDPIGRGPGQLRRCGRAGSAPRILGRRPGPH